MTVLPIAILGASLLGQVSPDAYAPPCTPDGNTGAVACPANAWPVDGGWTDGALSPGTDAAGPNCCCCCCGDMDCYLMQYLVGPGDLHPHYAYYPQLHGYYYFRPYNHMHVLYDAATVAAWGGDPRAPYSVEFLRPFFAAAGPEPRGFVPAPFADNLPKLEDLLYGGRVIEMHPSIEGAIPPAIEAPEPGISPAGFDHPLGPRL